MIVGLLLGLSLGVAAALVLASRASTRLASARATHAAELGGARAEVASLEASLEHERIAARELRAADAEVRDRLAGEFATLSRQALQDNTAQFLDLAAERFARAQSQARGDLDVRTRAMEELLGPLREQLTRYEEGMRLIELERQRAYTGLSEQVRQLGESQDKLQSETRNLVTALRSPATRGRWGEMQLRRVVEVAGMVEHCDFDEQVTVSTGEGRVRPDLVVHLPGAKHVVVDAKVPLQAFLDANDATDEEARRGHLSAHARHLRAHVDSLSKKAYWEQFADTPEFVVAFVPGDALLAAALEQDASLLEHAVASHVLLATPTTLIALLRAVGYGWQQEALAENAREVQLMARELYKRLATFGEHMAKTGKSLSGAVEAYNKAVGSLERNVLPQARRFCELGVVGGADKEVPALESIDGRTRRLEAPEFSVPGRAVPRELGLELIEGSREDYPELPGAAAT